MKHKKRLRLRMNYRFDLLRILNEIGGATTATTKKLPRAALDWLAHKGYAVFTETGGISPTEAGREAYEAFGPSRWWR